MAVVVATATAIIAAVEIGADMVLAAVVVVAVSVAYAALVAAAAAVVGSSVFVIVVVVVVAADDVVGSSVCVVGAGALSISIKIMPVTIFFSPTASTASHVQLRLCYRFSLDLD